MEDTCDLIEVNHFYDDHGKLIFDQVIFYDWKEQMCLVPGPRPWIVQGGRFQVRAWRMFKRQSQFPHKRNDMWESCWSENGILRKVRAKHFRETWTQYDPELLEQNFLPKEKRRELTEATKRMVLSPNFPSNAAGNRTR